MWKKDVILQLTFIYERHGLIKRKRVTRVEQAQLHTTTINAIKIITDKKGYMNRIKLDKPIMNGHIKCIVFDNNILIPGKYIITYKIVDNYQILITNIKEQNLDKDPTQVNSRASGVGSEERSGPNSSKVDLISSILSNSNDDKKIILEKDYICDCGWIKNI